MTVQQLVMFVEASPPAPLQNQKAILERGVEGWEHLAEVWALAPGGRPLAGVVQFRQEDGAYLVSHRLAAIPVELRPERPGIWMLAAYPGGQLTRRG